MKNKNIIISVIVILIIIIILLFVNSSGNDTNDTTNEQQLTENNENQIVAENTEESSHNRGEGGAGGAGGAGGGGSQDLSLWPNSDLLEEMIATTANKFIQLEYVNEETGITIPYNLFIPENYDSSKEYPLVLFIHDASVVSDDVTATLTQGFGALIWATDEWQAENECFVLAPQFDETIANDEYVLTEKGYETINLLNEVIDSYSIDEDRLYITGQSMGCMTSIELNIAYPDLFAASFYVAGQWDVEKMRELADDTMFFIVAGGDPKASPSMDSFIEVLDEENAEYAYATWDAQWSDEMFDEAVQEILSENKSINLVKFEEGSTITEGIDTSNPTIEHMLTWRYTYLIEGVRDWLFAQSK